MFNWQLLEMRSWSRNIGSRLTKTIRSGITLPAIENVEFFRVWGFKTHSLPHPRRRGSRPFRSNIYVRAGMNALVLLRKTISPFQRNNSVTSEIALCRYKNMKWRARRDALRGPGGSNFYVRAGMNALVLLRKTISASEK